jgi:uncharacterized protein with NRDE domain
MCLLFISHRSHADYPLLVAANRDEFFGRATQQAHRWDSGIVAGRDGVAGGTWLGVRQDTESGIRFAAITNRRGGAARESARSRGELTAGFLGGELTAIDYAAQVQARAGDYAGFNLLVGDSAALCYASSEADSMRELEPGLYGLSNGVLEEPWPKLRAGKQRMADLLANEKNLTTDQLIALMDDRSLARDEDLPATGLPLELERRLSSAFIENSDDQDGLADYGTLCSTAVMLHATGELRFQERNFDSLGRASRSHFFHFPGQL